MIIKEAVEKYLEGVIAPDELYSDARKIGRNTIHEIAKIEVELVNGDIIHVFDVEKYVYDEGHDTGFIVRITKPAYYSVWYARPQVELLDTPMFEKGRRCKGTPVDIKDVRVYSKKDVSIQDLMKRYEAYETDGVFDDTLQFQLKYGLLTPKDYAFMPPKFLEDENMKMKIGHMQEELDEIKKAYENRDLAETADRLMDLIYVAAGLCNLMCLPAHYLWCDVQNSNMAFKERVTSLDKATKRGSTFDVRKTDRWIAPRGQELIDQWIKDNEESEEKCKELAEVLEKLKA